MHEVAEVIATAPLASFVTTTAQGLISTPVPLFLDRNEGEYGILYGHLARGNPQWRGSEARESLAIFMGPEAYIRPSWYPTKRQTGKVVPTWNYVTVHAYGVPTFFEDKERLLDVITRLTSKQETSRSEPWSVTDAPEGFIDKQLSAIVGIRMPITRIEAKKKMSQNRTIEERAGVAIGLQCSTSDRDRAVASLIPQGE